MPAAVPRQHNPLLDLSPFAVELTRPRGIIPETGEPFVAEVTVNEDHSDDLQITDHPVQAGAFINDHAFKRPAELQMQMGWSSAYAFDLGISDVNDIYHRILELQASRLPFTIITGRRVYYNMLIASLRTHVDQRLEYTFLADIAFREVVLVNTSVVSAGQIFANYALRDETLISGLRTGEHYATEARVQLVHVPDELRAELAAQGFGTGTGFTVR